MLYVLHFMLMALICWLVAGLWLNEKLFPQLKRVMPADALNAWLQNWQIMSTQGGSLSSLGEIPQFKFFSRLAEAGLRHARQFGSFPRDLLWEWRDGLAKEKNFDHKWRGVLLSAYFQFGLFTLITWCFVLACSELLSGAGMIGPYFLMIILQILGFVLFAPLMKMIMKKRLGGLGELLECLYVLRSLSGAGLSTSQVIKEARFENLVSTKEHELIFNRVKDLVQIYQKQGGALGREAQVLLQEVWFLREESMGKLVKTGEGIKLVFLILFFAASYFLFLSGLVWQLLRAS